MGRQMQDKVGTLQGIPPLFSDFTKTKAARAVVCFLD
jgi:hypothetical protein